MEEKIIKKSESRIDMPKSIKIGDPLYFETGDGLKYTYSKSFKGKKDWACILEVKESILTFPPDEYSSESMKFNETSFTVILAYDETMLNLIKNNKMYTRQSIKDTRLGVDTAEYILGINSLDIEIKTGGDGSIGFVREYYTKSKLEAILIDISISEHGEANYNYAKKVLEKLFNCKLQDITI